MGSDKMTKKRVLEEDVEDKCTGFKELKQDKDVTELQLKERGVDYTFGLEHPRNLIPELCRLFYSLGWVTGTGGGMSIKEKGVIYIAPSGVQKERMQPDELFLCDENGKDLAVPNPAKQLKKSQCTPLFMNAYLLRNAGAVIHSHSQNSVMITLTHAKEFRIRNMEMIKGIKRGVHGPALRYDDELVVPIIENTPFEEDLQESMAECMKAYPETCCVLVRRHGFYCWGKDWKSAKCMTECFEYLFEIGYKMKQMGMDPNHESKLNLM
eukprot:Nk52_evm18s360 gene=Nk52_evmTU18s360